MKEEQSEYTKSGGKWLSTARSWIQNNCANGDHVIWGSDEILLLRRNFTPAVVEELAAQIADAANDEADEMKRQLEKTRENRLRSEIELTARAERAERENGEMRSELRSIYTEQFELLRNNGDKIPPRNKFVHKSAQLLAAIIIVFCQRSDLVDEVDALRKQLGEK